MDDSRFDAWTRRTFGRAVGGAAATLLSLRVLDDAAAAPKERCRKLTKPCSNQDRCCGSLTCGRSAIRDGRFCCRKGEAPCRDSKDCCKPALCTDNLCQAV